MKLGKIFFKIKKDWRKGKITRGPWVTYIRWPCKTGRACGSKSSSENSLILLSSGNTALPRSGPSFRLSSTHWRAILAKLNASSSGQSDTIGSSTYLNVSFPIALSTRWINPIGGLAVIICRSMMPKG